MNNLSKQRIIISGYIIRRPVGGLTWHYLHYVIGLAQMGHEVFYLEDSEDYPSCFNPRKAANNQESERGEVRQPFEQLSWNAEYGLNYASSVFDRIGLSEHWAYYNARTKLWHGPGAKHIKEICRNADVLLNISHSIPLRPWLMDIPSRVLIDTDPVFGQIRHIHVPGWLERALHHNVFLTFGENFKKDACTIPDDGLPWKSTRQPLVLDKWPTQDQPEQLKFSTVMSWKSYDPAKNEGTEYGLKSDSFLPYVDLPFKTKVNLELAIDSSPSLRQMLIEKGWNLLNALDVTRNPWSYQNYIQKSAAEFSIAKQAYVMTNSGWFSERSAAYLASGRPVLTQETGFSEWLVTDGGVVPFISIEEAVAGIECISGDYKRHSKAARKIAETFFNHELVLSRVLDQASLPSESIILEASVTGSKMLANYHSVLEIIGDITNPECSLILIDDNQWGVFGIVAGRKCYPFLEKDGLYWGNPVDDQQAIAELERLRRQGASFLVFAKPAFWWLEYYDKFYDYLSSKYHCAKHDEELIILDLRQPA